MATDIALTQASRSSLLSLQNTTDLISRTQGRLSTGKRINSIIDDPVNFFKAKTMDDLAKNRSGYKDEVDQGISVIKGALTGIESARTLVETMKGLAEEARNGTTTEQVSLQSKARQLTTELNNLLRDAGFNGVNLVYNDASVGATSLTVDFSDDSTYTVSGKNLTSNGIGVTNSSITLDSTNVGSSIAFIEAALTRLDSAASTYGTDAALFQTRLDFSSDFINTLEEASGKLTLADLNEESANLLALQTRQQLAVSSLSLAAQTEQSILGLF